MPPANSLTSAMAYLAVLIDRKVRISRGDRRVHQPLRLPHLQVDMEMHAHQLRWLAVMVDVIDAHDAPIEGIGDAVSVVHDPMPVGNDRPECEIDFSHSYSLRSMPKRVKKNLAVFRL